MIAAMAARAGVGRSQRGAPASWPQRAGARRRLRLRCGSRCRGAVALPPVAVVAMPTGGPPAGTAVAYTWLQAPVAVYAAPTEGQPAGMGHGSCIRAAARVPRAGLGSCSRASEGLGEGVGACGGEGVGKGRGTFGHVFYWSERVCTSVRGSGLSRVSGPPRVSPVGGLKS